MTCYQLPNGNQLTPTSSAPNCWREGTDTGAFIAARTAVPSDAVELVPITQLKEAVKEAEGYWINQFQELAKKVGFTDTDFENAWHSDDIIDDAEPSLPAVDANDPGQLRFATCVMDQYASSVWDLKYESPNWRHMFEQACARAHRLERERAEKAKRDNLIERAIDTYFTTAHGNVPKTIFPHVRDGMRAVVDTLLADGESR